MCVCDVHREFNKHPLNSNLHAIKLCGLEGELAKGGEVKAEGGEVWREWRR